jgi:peptidoglycan/LPS O-acetylase OafA/YrhL
MSPADRPTRWGLRALGFLALALLSLTVSNWPGSGGYGNLLILSGLVVGLVGAGVCSVRGIRQGWESLRR